MTVVKFSNATHGWFANDGVCTGGVLPFISPCFHQDFTPPLLRFSWQVLR